MVQLLILATGIIIVHVVNRTPKMIALKTLSKRFGISQLEMSRDTPLVKATKRLASWIPISCWQGLTWSLFLAGYVYKSLHVWKSTLVYIACRMVFDCVSPALKLILDLAWYCFTVYRAAHLCNRDHEDYLALGAGGTPQTWNGFKRITLLEWFGKINTLEAPSNSIGLGYLEPLEERPGPRPRVVGIAPQRQLDQRAPRKVYDLLLTYLDHLSAENTSSIRTATSFLEQHIEALTASSDCVTSSVFHTFGCEIAHPHEVDGSMHCMLHPADIKMVIRTGWAERHSIARADFWWMWWFFAFEGRPPIPEHLCFIYAPRNEHEVCIVSKIVQAGIAYVVGPDSQQYAW